MTHYRPGSTFRMEATSVEEFLRLLSGRETAVGQSRGPRDSVQRTVFVTPLQGVMSGRYGSPKVTRSVVAAFAFGAYIVTYTRTTSNAVELPKVASKLAERQREACEQLRAEIERGLEESDLRVPVHEGVLRHLTDN